jgi:hypothetical protein
MKSKTQYAFCNTLAYLEFYHYGTDNLTAVAYQALNDSSVVLGLMLVCFLSLVFPYQKYHCDYLEHNKDK